MNNKEIIDLIFNDPKVKYELSEFNKIIDFEKDIEIIEKEGTGKNKDKKIYFLKTLAPFHSEKEGVQIYVEGGKSNPEEIVRQFWVHKLIKIYNYTKDEIELEKPITFGGDVGTKFADIVVHTNKDKTTPKIVFEIKKPNSKYGIEQLKSYLNAEGSPIGIWSNGSDKIILYRPYPNDFDALPEIPKQGQDAKDVQDEKLTLAKLEKDFNFKKILLDLEELVLGSSGVNVFNEIFKIIFAKIWDEKQAHEVREDQSLEFKWLKDPSLTYDRINNLYKKAAEEWKGIFNEHENIKLSKEHLSVCIAPLERKRFLGSNLRIMDEAFEFLLPNEAKKKKGQFFTPRFVIDMCVRMLNPKRTEFIIDPACGSAGFLIHAMEWVYPVKDANEMERRKHHYAAKYLWGVDFEEQAAKTSRALMLIAGDGHSNIFGPDVDTLEPKTWFRNSSGRDLLNGLKAKGLTKNKIPHEEIFDDEDKAWEYFEELKFDVILSNPPFAGEVKIKEQLKKYELAKGALRRGKNKQAKEERDVLFIERIMKMLKPGGRAAIVLPQGKFNNSSLAFIREWILRKARLLAVVGLHQNTFKPHTGTKTSVLFIQKYTDKELKDIQTVQQTVSASSPNYSNEIKVILEKHKDSIEIPEDEIPENILELIVEQFSEPESEPKEDDKNNDEINGDSSDEEVAEELSLEEKIELAENKIKELQSEKSKQLQNLLNLETAVEALETTQKTEIETITNNWSGTKKDLTAHLKPIKEEHKEKLKTLKEAQKTKKAEFKKLVTQLEKDIPYAKTELKLLTNKGKLQLILEDAEMLQKLSDRFIDAEVAKKLDYPIFMAVSEQGGKNNSGDYEYLINEDGNIEEDSFGNPIYNQDLVNYNLTKEALQKIDSIEENHLCIAETFIKYAVENNFSFWS